MVVKLRLTHTVWEINTVFMHDMPKDRNTYWLLSQSVSTWNSKKRIQDIKNIKHHLHRNTVLWLLAYEGMHRKQGYIFPEAKKRKKGKKEKKAHYINENHVYQKYV